MFHTGQNIAPVLWLLWVTILDIELSPESAKACDAQVQLVPMTDSNTDLLTPYEVAKIIRMSTDTVHRYFADCEGVVDYGTPETRHKRRYRILRIPRRCVDEFLHEKQKH